MTLVASFDLQITDDIAIYGMRLLRHRTGGHVTYAPTFREGLSLVRLRKVALRLLHRCGSTFRSTSAV